MQNTQKKSDAPLQNAGTQIVRHADLKMQVTCSQIAADYLKFIKVHVIKDVPGCGDVNLKELMVLLLIDAMGHKTMKSHEVATVLRIDAATVSRGVYALIAKDYLTAVDDVYDNRSKVFTLTEKSNLFLKNYRVRCVEAVIEANERLGHTEAEHNAIIQTGYEALYRLKDRASAFKGLNFKSRQRFRSGQGRARPGQTPSDDHLFVFADYVFRIFADQIASDYLAFIKKNVVKEMNTVRKLSIREIRILMTIDFHMRPVMASEVCAVMRNEPATVSRGLSILIDLGLVYAVDNDEDGRSKLLALTDDGQAYAERFKSLSHEKISAAEDHLGFHWDDEMRQNALRALDKVKLRSAALAGLKRQVMRRSFESAEMSTDTHSSAIDFHPYPNDLDLKLVHNRNR